MSKGITNGARGTLISVNNEAGYITLKLDTRPDEITIINKVVQRLILPGGRVICRRQYPLILGWAMTVHRVQGMTLSSVSIQIKHMWHSAE